MWNFVFGLIVGVIGSMFISTKSPQPLSIVVVVEDGDTTSTSLEDVELENLEKYILSEDEFEMMSWLTNYSIFLQTISDTAKWN